MVGGLGGYPCKLLIFSPTNQHFFESMIFLISMLGICDCFLEGRDSLSFFCLVFFVCGWWWFRLRDTLCVSYSLCLKFCFMMYSPENQHFPLKSGWKTVFFRALLPPWPSKNEAPTFHHSGSQNTLKKHPDCLGHVFFVDCIGS